MADLQMEGAIDYIGQLIARQFANEVSQIYFGDVGIYPPKAFQNQRNEQCLVVALVPNYDKLVPGSKSGLSEDRDIGIFVVVMVNMTPYFEAMPKEAFGERQLVRLTTRIREFLAQDSNFDLQGKVLKTKVGDVNWEWTQRGQTAIRAAAIEYEFTSTVSRLQA